jgi:hypothetical protein
MVISEVIKMLEELRDNIGDVHVYFSDEKQAPVPVDPEKELLHRIGLVKLGVRRNGEVTR